MASTVACRAVERGVVTQQHELGDVVGVAEHRAGRVGPRRGHPVGEKSWREEVRRHGDAWCTRRAESSDGVLDGGLSSGGKRSLDAPPTGRAPGRGEISGVLDGAQVGGAGSTQDHRDIGVASGDPYLGEALLEGTQQQRVRTKNVSLYGGWRACQSDWDVDPGVEGSAEQQRDDDEPLTSGPELGGDVGQPRLFVIQKGRADDEVRSAALDFSEQCADHLRRSRIPAPVRDAEQWGHVGWLSHRR